jgi:histidyl-tRNA synthetase
MKQKFQAPRGTKDYLPEEMARRKEVFDRIRNVFESYGYGEICTPAFEDLALLTKKSGPDIEKEIYSFKDKSGRSLGLRFDPTVPICRIVSSLPSIAKPVKFYYITNMWRYDRPQKGRMREFWQCGVELIGSNKEEADAEIIALVAESLKAIGIKSFYFRINTRGIVEELVKKAEIPDKKKFDVFRAIDKLAKIGEKGVREEMISYGIKPSKARKFLELIRKGKGEDEKLKNIIKILKGMGIRNVEIDLSIVRGIDYYTGFVFETFVKGEEDLGSVASGGRYDSLISLYGGGNLPATGFGIGIERLMEVVKSKSPSRTKVFVINVSGPLLGKAIEIASKLRKKGISTENDLMGRNLRKQLDYINSKKIPYAVFVGEKELKKKKFTLRDMKTGKQKEMGIPGLVKALG